MPFKSFSLLRPHADLQAEVRGVAALTSPGLVAVLSTDPVRIASVPISGAGIKVTDVSLDGADQVALLSRDVALVRATDDAIWALLNITHTPKIDQVARDMRSLVMCPVGGSALGIAWDGSATAFTLGTNEVVARSFALRGTLRACDLTDTETFALVDGADGGQLRVHPGATPEPGASLRGNLPMEAAAFDQVRAGKRLAVVFKQGGRTACVLTGGPNRLLAKLVAIDPPPVDIAVAETSMVVVSADGRVALYNGDTIASAPDGGPMAPKYSTQPALRGEPRRVIVVSKGESTAWIGTSAGEVASLGLVKKTAAV